MDRCRIERINELARKAKEAGLSEEEKTERDGLRREYIESCKESLRNNLTGIVKDQNKNK